jgi:hypothetical protein
MKAKQIHSTTQEFTNIQDIRDNLVLFKTGDACRVLEVSSVNFDLLSRDEQEARIFSFASFLNSLSFSVQILIVSKKVNVTGYINLVEEKIKNSQDPKIKTHLIHYRDFVQQLTKTGEILDKKIYLVIPFSRFEEGVSALLKKGKAGTPLVFEAAKKSLQSKQNQIFSTIQRMGLSARVLTTEELIGLFHELLNQDSGTSVPINSNSSLVVGTKT